VLPVSLPCGSRKTAFIGLLGKLAFALHQSVARARELDGNISGPHPFVLLLCPTRAVCTDVTASLLRFYPDLRATYFGNNPGAAGNGSFVVVACPETILTSQFAEYVVRVRALRFVFALRGVLIDEWRRAVAQSGGQRSAGVCNCGRGAHFPDAVHVA
jgi:hypothetical protein